MNTLLIVHGKRIAGFLRIYESARALHARLSEHVIDSDQYEESVKEAERNSLARVLEFSQVR